MGGTCGTYWGEREYVQGLRGETEERSYLEDVDVDWRIILK